jgi:hypothetical protein
MEVYRTNSTRIPLMAGLVVPEPVFSRAAYERDILERLYESMQPVDPEGILRHEFANARGAMARFDRGAIEIRVIDLQECPAADTAVAALIIETVKSLTQERWVSYDLQQEIDTEQLHRVLLATIEHAEDAIVDDPALLSIFGLPERPISAGNLWQHLFGEVMPTETPVTRRIKAILSAGTLASRILKHTGPRPTHKKLASVYRELCDCLEHGVLFGVESI